MSSFGWNNLLNYIYKLIYYLELLFTQIKLFDKWYMTWQETSFCLYIWKFARFYVSWFRIGEVDPETIGSVVSRHIIRIGKILNLTFLFTKGFVLVDNASTLYIAFLSIILNRNVRLCKVVELSIQCCGKLLSDSFETY